MVRKAMNIMRRIYYFDRQDWKHVMTLFLNGIKQFFLLNWEESKEAFIWIKIHMSYDSTKIK